MSDKSNEITAIPALLEMLDVTNDSDNGCDGHSKDDCGSDSATWRGLYPLPQGESSHPLSNRWKDGFKRHRLKARAGIEHTFDERVETGHHRIEKRQVWVVPRSQLPPLHEAADWSGLKAVVFVQRVRHLWNKTTREIQFYLTSLPADSPKIASAIRSSVTVST